MAGEGIGLSHFEAVCQHMDCDQWSQLLGRGLEPMGWAGQAFSPGPRYKPMWLAPNTNLV